MKRRKPKVFCAAAERMAKMLYFFAEEYFEIVILQSLAWNAHLELC